MDAACSGHAAIPMVDMSDGERPIRSRTTMAFDDCPHEVGSDAWLSHYRPAVLSYAYNFSRNIDDAEDAVQVAMWTGVATGKLGAAANPVGWLCTAARNLLIDGRRRRSAVPLMSDIADPRTQQSPTGVDGDDEEGRVNPAALRAALDTLDDVSRWVIETYYIGPRAGTAKGRWTDARIGAHLFPELSEPARLHRARRIRLRALQSLRVDLE
jgi:hypothetical protein